MKTCTLCKIPKEEKEFNFKNKLKEILHSRCKQCQKEIDDTAYKNNKHGRSDRIRINAKEQIKKAKAFVRKLKESSWCEKCGDSRWYVLDFHHVGTKKDTISEMVKKGSSLTRISMEIEECSILCSNCHREEHFLNGDEANRVEASV